MTPDLDKLAALAGAATGGEWYQSGAPWFPDACVILSGSEDPHLARFVADTARDDWSEHPGDPIFAEADAAYIAAANPSVVLALVERVRLAGHRTEDEHDCFVMNCRGLGGEVLRLNRELAECHGWTVEETDGTVRIAAPDPHDAHDDEAAARWTAQPLGAARIESRDDAQEPVA